MCFAYSCFLACAVTDLDDRVDHSGAVGRVGGGGRGGRAACLLARMVTGLDQSAFVSRSSWLVVWLVWDVSAVLLGVEDRRWPMEAFYQGRGQPKEGDDGDREAHDDDEVWYTE